MRIGWVGFHAEGVAALEAVCSLHHDVVGLMTLCQEKARRRSGAVNYSALCERFGIPEFGVDHINDESSLEILRSWDCDLLVVLGWGQILSRDALTTAKVGVVGAHASLLPHNRGSAPVNWAIINGESETGNSLIWLAEGVDAGALIDQRAFPITPYDTCKTIYDQVAASNRDMLLGLLEKVEAGETPGKAQKETGEPVLRRRRPKDGLIDWTNSSEHIYNLVRALARPYPGAFGTLHGETYFVWQLARLPIHNKIASPGTVIGPVTCPNENACGILVATGDGAILVLEVEDKSGRTLMGRELCEHDWTGMRLRRAA